MCGLILSLYAREDAVMKGLYAMGHRGTLDPTVVDAVGGWTVGHIRLPIQTDQTTGVQPFRRGNEVMVFVGEVFTTDDGLTEEDVLWDCVHSHKLDKFHDIDGFWAIVHVNDQGTAFVITDHIGTKPLYYWPEEGVVSSEIEAMFAMFPRSSRPPVDKTYISNCMKFGYDYSARTAWEGVYQIPPGTVLTLNPMGPTFNAPAFRYWDWHRVETKGLSAEFNMSVRNRVKGILDKTEPPALLLSGGLDSTLIYRAAKQNGLQVDLFSYVEEGSPDSKFISMAAAGAPVHNIKTDQEFLKITAYDVVTAMQAPIDLGSVQPQLELARGIYRTSETNVVLTGDGADELFGGYRRAMEYDSQHSDVFCELPYYHLPRLDRVHMRFQAEVRSPFLSPGMIAEALRVDYKDRTCKQKVKKLAIEYGVPAPIIYRPKEPLKSKSVRDGGVGYRNKLKEAFYNYDTFWRTE